jgi:hypothetical protein
MLSRRRHSPCLPPLPHSEDRLPECYPSQRPRHRFCWDVLLLFDEDSVAEEGMGFKDQISGLWIVQAENIQYLLLGYLLCCVSQDIFSIHNRRFDD